VNKRQLVEQIIAALTAELEGYKRSARAAHAEATNEQSKAENKYDTRGLEAAYLARGQSRQAAEIVAAMQQYESLPLREFAPGEPIDLGAVVIVERSGQRTVYFVGPRAGGTEVQYEDDTALVITPQSPVGQRLMGRRQGESLELAIGGKSLPHQIAAVF
jgi:transcription elongation GreA/GreB family factor